MAKARRTPPLFEVLSERDRRRPVPNIAPKRPVEVQVPQSSGTPNLDTGAPKPARPAAVKHGRSPAFTWGAVAIVLSAIFATWYFAVKFGEDRAAKKLVSPETVKPTPSQPIPIGPTPTPGDNLGPQGPGLVNPTPGNGDQATPIPTPPITPPEPAKAENPDADPREPGMNYLHIVKLNWREAEAAVKYLNANGVPAAAVPDRRVDPKSARDKNLPHLIFALDAIAPDRYSATANQRKALVDKVKRVGLRFQKEEKGASDFAEPYWAKFQTP